jgi:protease IV
MKYLKRFFKGFFQFWKNAALFLGSVMLFFIILIIVLIRSASDLSTPEINQRLVYQGNQQEIAYVRLSGEISSQADESFLGFNPFVINPHRIRQVFSYLAEDKNVKAVVVEVNSPGGSVVASEEVYQQMIKLADSKPVLVYMGEAAASGGYYIALPAEKIVASVPTITGSIGVLVFDPDLSGLYEKIGVQMQTYQTGQFKDIGSMNRASTEEEVQIFESIIGDAYQQFLDRIIQHRDLTETEVRALADGRIYSGKQAKENGLIDELGTLDDAFEFAKETADLTDPSIIEYSYGGSPFSSLLGVRGLGILPTGLLELQGQSRMGLHYLWVR